MKINKKIYETIAIGRKVSAKQVKEKIQLALDVAWDSNNEKLRELFPKGKPTLDEFLITIKDEILHNASC